MTTDPSQQPPPSPSSERAPSSPESITSAPSPLLITPNPEDEPEHDDPYNEQDYIRPIFQRGKRGSLHLTPCTLQQYQDLGHDHNDPYDLVDGLLVSVPPMDDPEHQSLGFWLVQLLSQLPVGQNPKIQPYCERTIRLLFAEDKRDGEETSAPRSPDQGSSSQAGNQPSSSKRSGAGSSKSHARPTSHESKSDKVREESSSRTEAETCRRPDFCVVDGKAGSENSDIPISPFELKRGRTGEWKRAIMVGEITSTNRMKDLKDRLKEYQRERIPEYIICDRQKLLPHRNPCVVVHTYDKNTRKYDKKVYSKNDVVKCSFFDHWKLTADQMLDYKYIKRLFLEKKDGLARQQGENADLKRDKANLQEENARKDGKIANLQEEKADLQEERAHFIDYCRGRRKTPPRSLQLVDSQLKVKERAKTERGEASSSSSVPKSPRSPPLRVRKVTNTDVKTSSHRKHKSEKSDKK